MVNYKLLSLPLLVGLLSKRVSADPEEVIPTCTLSDYTGTGCTVSAECTTENDGYYYDNSVLYLLDTSKSTDAQKCTKVTTNGYYATKNTQELIKVTAGGTATQESEEIGYYKSGSTEYVACNSSNECKIIEEPSEECGPNNVGKLGKDDSNVVLCLAEYTTSTNEKIYPSLKFETGNDKVYFVQHVKSQANDDRVFNYDVTMNYYAVKTTSDSILLDTTFNRAAGNAACADYETGEFKTRKEDFCSTTSTGKYYVCTDGKCQSYLQSKYDVQELNGEVCSISCNADYSSCTANGNCPNGYYAYEQKLLYTDDNGSTIAVATVTSSDFTGYYPNAALDKKDQYPLIKCDGENGSNCQMIEVDENAYGYYIGLGTTKTVVECTSQSQCQIPANLSNPITDCSASGVGKISNEVKFCIASINGNAYIKTIADSQEVIKETFYLENVDATIFNSIPKNGNYAVEINSEQNFASVLIKDIVKEKCEQDNTYVQKELGGTFYYCAGGEFVEMKNDGAKFAIKIGENYEIVQVSSTTVDIVKRNTATPDHANYFQDKYYIDRSTNGGGLIKCKVNADADTDSETDDDYICESFTTSTLFTDAYINSETGFVENEARLIVCDSGNCKAAVENSNKIELNGKELGSYFTNVNKSIITCTGITCTEQLPADAAPTPTLGMYINGMKELSLLKCIEVKTTGDDSSEVVTHECSVIDAKKYGYYAAFDKKLIHCNNEKCTSELSSATSPITYLNGDDASDKKIVECSSANSGCIEVEAFYYYVDEQMGGRSLLKCDSQACTRTEGEDRGVYISGDKPGNRLIKCDVNECTIMDGVTPAVAGVDTEYYLNGDLSAPKIITVIEVVTEAERKRTIEYKFGYPETALAKEFAVFKNGNRDGSSGKALIYCSSDSSCNEAETVENDLHIDINNGKIIKIGNGSDVETTILSAGTAGDEVYFLADKLTSKVITSGGDGSSLVVCTKTAEGRTCEYKTTSDNYLIEDVDGAKYLISVNGNSYSVTNSGLAIGYYLNSDSGKTIKCDTSSSCDYYTSEDCSDTTKGSFKNGALCISNENTRDSEGLYVIETLGTKFAGYAAGTYLIRYSNNKIVIETSTEKRYYLVSENNIVNSKDENGDVYYCTATCTKETVSDGKNYPNDDSETLGKGYLNIVCSKDENDNNNVKCSYSSKTGNEVYCFKNSKLQQCQSNCDTGCVEITHKTGDYLHYEKNKLIHCTVGSSCSELKGASLKSGYYVSADPTKPLILCTKLGEGNSCSNDVAVNNGYYINSKNKLISCKDGKCTDVDSPTAGWYVSGEPGKKLIKYESTSSYEGFLKPNLGWYINSGSDNAEYPLIRCTSEASGVSCVVSKIVNKGNYLNAGDKTKLIDLTGAITSIPIVDDQIIKYYINGENKKLIQCQNGKCIEKEGNSGYYAKLSDGNSDSLIICKNNECEESQNNNKNGYYLNADELTKVNKPLLYVDDADSNHIKYVNGEEIINGWYLNGDTSDANRIIYCKSGTSPTCAKVEVGDGTCKNEFKLENGELKWCVNGGEEFFIKSGEETRAVFSEFANKNIPWLDDRKGIIKFVINSNKIIQEKVNGYYYDEINEILYQCSGYGNGLCEKRDINDSLKAGIYLNYDAGKDVIIKCGYDQSKDSMRCENVNTAVNCNNYNVIKDSSNNSNSLCRKKIANPTQDNLLKIDEVESDKVYAIDVRGLSFPKTKQLAGKSFRYALVSVSKYVVSFVEAVEEVQDCPEESDESADDKIVCLKGGNQLVKLNDLDSTITGSGNIQIRKQDNANENIVYDADTNNGYFEYNSSYELIKVYIRRSVVGGKDYKDVCEIGEECYDSDIKEEPVLGYSFGNGIMQMVTRDESDYTKTKTSEINKKITPGVYYVFDNVNKNNNAKAIKCEEDNEFGGVKCEEMKISQVSSNIDFSSGVLSFKLGGNKIQSDKKFSKFIIARKDNNSNLRKRDQDDKLYINELSAASYNEFIVDKTVNIFLDENYRKIENDININVNYVKAYTCKTNGECIEISKVGNDKYLLNSAQEGKRVNAVVKCGSGKCEFIDAKENLKFENFAATNDDEAVITCDATSCKTEKASTSGKLPDCQYYIDGDGESQPIIDEITNSCMIGVNEKLLEGQHCILNGKIYKYSGQECTDIVPQTMNLFDVTYRKLGLDIAENHIGAILYRCPKANNCYVTYGYITGSAGFSKCDSEFGCKYYEKSELKSNCEEAGQGGLVFDTKYKLCSGNKAYYYEKGKYLVDINVKDNFPETKFGDKILVSMDSNVFSMVVTDGYILVSEKVESGENKNVVVENLTDAGKLYKCTSVDKKCEKVEEIDYGYYYSKEYEKVIKCDSSCKLIDTLDGIDFVNDSTVESSYYYKPSGFPGYSYGVIVKSTMYEITSFKVNNYVLINSEENRLASKSETKDMKDLYLCNSITSKCEKKDVEDGWFISSLPGVDAYRCENGACVVVDNLNGKTCSKEGAIIKRDGVPQLCIKKKGSNQIGNESLSDIRGKLVEITSTKDKNEFPNKKNYLSVQSNSVIGIGYIDKENSEVVRGIATCDTVGSTCKKIVAGVSSNLEKDEYCMSGTSIYSTVDDNGKCEQQFTEGVFVEIFKNFKKIESANADAKGTARQMVYCKNGVCELATGYRKYSGSYIECNTYECKDPAGSDIGNLTGGRLKVKSNSSLGFGKDTFGFISGVNSFPGTEMLNSFLVEIGETYMVPFKGSGYYIIGSNNKMLMKDPVEEESSTGNLYQCTNDGNCAEVNSNVNQFIVNAGANETKQALIECNESNNCKLAAIDGSIDAEQTDSKCKKAGVLKHSYTETTEEDGSKTYTYGEYKLCTKKDENPITININSDTVTYFMLTVDKDDKFVDVPLNKIPEGSSAQIIIEIGNGKIRQYNKEGYILYNTNKGEIIENVGGGSGASLFYCENKELKVNDAESRTYNCKAESKINKGWYFNSVFGDKRVIRCASECLIQEVKEDTECLVSGSIIYNNGFKICQSMTKQISMDDVTENNKEIDVIMNVKSAVEFPGLTVDNTEILLSIKPNKAYQVSMSNNLVVNKEMTAVKDSYGTLYQCGDDGKCVANYIPKDSWYIKKDTDGKPVELIKCENRVCKVYSEEIPSTASDIEKRIGGLLPGFRAMSANVEKPLIHCERKYEIDEDSDEKVQKDKSHCEESSFKEGWFLNALSSSDHLPLIECSNELGCVATGGIGNGYYLNAGSDSTYKVENVEIKPLIKCESGNCEQYSTEITECNAGGDIIKSGSSYKICKASGGTTIDFGKNSYEAITNEGSFPNAASGTLVVYVGKNTITLAGEGYYHIDGNMYECGENSCEILNTVAKDNMYVFNKITSSIYNSKCTEDGCSWSEIDIEGNVFLSGTDLVTNESVTSITEIYECNKISRKITCTEVLKANEIGYYFNNEIVDESGNKKTVPYLCKSNGETNECEVCSDEEDSECKINKCTQSYKKNVCFISYSNEPYELEDEPEIGSGNICQSDQGNYYFTINEVNTGIDNVNCILLADSNDVGYYMVDGIIYRKDKYSVRKTVAANALVSALDSNHIYWKQKSLIEPEYNHSRLNDGIWNENNSYYIRCVGGVCERVEMPTCSHNYKTKTCSGTGVNAGQLCVSSGKGNIYLALERLSNSGGKCVRYETSWSYSSGSNSLEPDYSDVSNALREKSDSTYYLVNEKIYKIESTNDVYIMGEGAYLIDESNKLVDIADGKSVDISKGGKVTLYICNETDCKPKYGCNSPLYNEYIFNSRNGRIMLCDPNDNTISYINNVKDKAYYINGPWENLIKCINGKCVIENNDNGKEGYYLDEGNENKIIKCERVNDKFSCVNEEVISCEYDNGKCKSDVDLLRNSYCLSVKRDDKGRKLENAKLVYVEKYIRAGESAECIYNGDDSKTFYYHYRKSKFLNSPEKEELIEYSKGSIVRVYEKDIGFYIINTNDRLGITSDVNLNKSRIYECNTNGCKEVRSPKAGRIYINKASSEKMVMFNGSSWKVLNNHCKVSSENKNQCLLDHTAGINEVIYLYEKDYEKPEFRASKKSMTTKFTLIENNDKLDIDKYQIINGQLYVIDRSEQFFEKVSDDGFYMFKNEILEGDEKKYNLVPYISSRNSTEFDDMKIYRVSYSSSSPYTNTLEEGYYRNRASINNEETIIEVMEIPKKEEVIDDSNNGRKRDDEEEYPKKKFKTLLNKCSSTSKNKCSSAIDDYVIREGSACIVLEGDYKGIYLATKDIGKTANTENCLRYDGSNSYYYIGENEVEFADEPKHNIIAEINRDEIRLFSESRNLNELIVIDNDKKVLKSTYPVSANAYRCKYEYQYEVDEEGVPIKDENDEYVLNLESKSFECNPLSSPDKYYYGEGSGTVKYGNGKWFVETSAGYYYFNSDSEPSFYTKDETTGEVDSTKGTLTYKYAGGKKNGYYINSASNIVTVVRRNNSQDRIVTFDLKKCTPSGEVCNPNETTGVNVGLVDGDVCLNGSKLYIVEEVVLGNNGEKRVMCYTGTYERPKYRFVNKKLWKLEGISVQEVESGYYIMNKDYTEFDSTYPEKPEIIIYCSSSSCEMDPKINVNSDVIINAAVTKNTPNKLLKYYKDSEKFANIQKPGYYYLSAGSEVKKNEYLSKGYYLDKNGVLTEKGSSSNVYINEALEGTLVRENYVYDKGSVTNNVKLNRIEYNGNINEAEENILIFIDGYLFKQKSDRLEHQGSGLYAIENDRPFNSNEFTKLTKPNICYYSSGSCNDAKLSSLKNHRFTVEISSGKPRVIEYRKSDDSWRIVDTPGVYFLFEENYSIDEVDRRIKSVYEVVEGDTIDITNSVNRVGFYEFNGLMIENNDNESWVDAKPVVRTVEVENGRFCNSYEAGVEVSTDGWCFNEGVCIPKELIVNDKSEVSNCVFTEDSSSLFFLVGEKLYSTSKSTLRNIRKDGIYVIADDRKVFESEFERSANGYVCENGKCEKSDEISEGYYLNMANGSSDVPVILYYNNSKKLWRKVNSDGYYFFNDKGYAVSDEEQVVYAYHVSKEGRVIENVIDGVDDGVYVSLSSTNERVVVECSNGIWNNARKINSCVMNDDGSVEASVELKNGDVCIDGESIIIITGGGSSGARKREVYKYVGVNTNDEAEKYTLDAETSLIVKVNKGSIQKVDVVGYAVLDSSLYEPFNSLEEKSAIVYKCDKSKCEVVDTESLVGERLFNEIYDEYPLLRVEESGKLVVESENGFFFFNSDLVAVEVSTTSSKSIVKNAVEVRTDAFGNIIQKDITYSNEIGFYINKASKEKVVVSNEIEFWSRGSEVHKCNITEIQEGFNCRTFEGELDNGSFCYDDQNEMLFILTGEANTEEDEEANCIAGRNEVPIYVDSKVVSNINGYSVGDKLVRLTEDSVKVVSSGIYILNGKGEVVDNNADGDEEIVIYVCDDNSCSVATDISPNERFIAENGEIYELVVVEEKNVLKKVDEQGIYFFNVQGKAAINNNDEIGYIIEINGNGERVDVTSNKFDKGIYINKSNDKYLSIFDGEEWSSGAINCEYDAEKKVCSSQDQLTVGGYCVSEGSFNLISGIDEESGDIYCEKVSDENVLLYVIDDELYGVGKTSIRRIEGEGYYAINEESRVAVQSEEPVKSEFIKCDEDSKCTSEIPEKNTKYLNKAKEEHNIVSFNDGDVEKAISDESQCVVTNGKCTAKSGSLVEGQVCVANNELYVVKSRNECVKSEKYVESLHYVNGKIYKIGYDVVTQMFDGYYFIRGNNHNVENVNDYSNQDTIGYICSKAGKCEEIISKEGSYYKDYASIDDGKFRVVLYDSGVKGYVIVKEEGIYKLEDGNYVECSIASNDEIYCNDINERGTKVTIDGEIVSCTINDNNEVECSQTVEGGYYNIDGVYHECTANESKLECKEVKKEGYFFFDKEKILYECRAKDSGLGVSSQLLGETIEISEEDIDDEVTEELFKRQEDDGDGESGNTDEQNVEEEESVGEVDVECEPVPCIEDSKLPLGVDSEDELYLCKDMNKVNAGEGNEDEDLEEDLRWVALKCLEEGGNNLKVKDGYECDEKKEDIDEKYIDKPNNDHTQSGEKPQSSTSSSSTKSSSSSSTKAESTSKPAETTSQEVTTTTTSEDKPTSTASTTGSASPTSTKKSGAIQMRSLPSIALYLVLTLLYIYIHY